MGLKIAFAGGAALVTAGAGLVSIPVGLIIAGLFVLAYAALFLLEV